MENVPQNPKKHPERIILVAATLLASFWVIDALMDSLIYGEGTVYTQLFSPDPREVEFRWLTAMVFIAFALYTRNIVNKRKELEKELEAAIQRAENETERTIAIVSAMGDGISIQDTDMKILYQNDAHKKLVGDHVGEFCYSAYNRKEQPCEGCHLIQSFQDGMIHRVETSGANLRGATHVEIISSPLRDKTGKIVAGIEVVRDISQRKQAQAALERQANLLQRLIDTIPSPIFYKDMQGVFLGCNAAFEHCSGMARDKVIGKTVFELFPEDIAVMYDKMDRELLDNPGVQIYESLVPCVESCAREVIFNKATYTDSDGTLAGLVGIVIDISEHKRTENEIRKLNEELSAHAAELDAANKELEAFSYSASHDLRTPLTRIYSASQALLEGYSHVLDENGRFFARTIYEACEQMEELVEALLALSRVTRSEMQREEVDISLLVLELAASLQQAEPERRVDFDIASDVKVNADPQLLTVALENLLGNAWKYTGKCGAARVEFGVTEMEGETVYFVRDNGAGFDMNKAADLFKPFHRLHNANDFPGTGVGLATVQRVIQRHGGRVWGEGAVDKGATFYFTLK